MKNLEADKIIKELDPTRLGKRASALADKMEKEGKSLKEAAGITDGMENEIYVLGKNYYDRGLYGEAVTIFEALCRINPTRYPYVFGLASAYHQAKDFINASLGFYTAFTLEPTNPLNTYYLADCMINLDAYEDATNFLELTIGIAEATGEEHYKPLAERCRLIKSSLKQKDTKKIKVKN